MANTVPKDWNFCAVVELPPKLSSPVDEVGDWFLSDLHWSFGTAYDCNDREIRQDRFEFEWFEDTDGKIVIDGFIDYDLSKEDAVNIALTVFSVLRNHSSNVMTEFYDQDGELVNGAVSP